MANYKKNFYWNLIGMVSSTTFFTVVLFLVARINGEAVGSELSLAFSLSVLFYSVGLYGGRLYQVSDVNNEFTDKEYILLRCLTTAIMPLLCLGFILFGGYSLTTMILLAIFTLMKMTETLGDVFYGILHKNNNLYIVGKSLLFRTVFGILAFLIIDLITRNIVLAGLATLAVNVGFLLFYDMRVTNVEFNRRYIPWFVHNVWKIENIRNMLKRCFPIAALSFLPNLAYNVPRFFLGSDGSDSGQMFFSVFLMPSTLFSVFVTLLVNPRVVHLSKEITKGGTAITKDIMRMLIYNIGLAAVVMVVAHFIGLQVLSLVYGVSFADYQWAMYMSIVAGAATGIGSMFISLLNILRKFTAQVLVFVIGIIILGIVSILTIGDNDVTAAVIAYTVYAIFTVIFFGLSYHLTMKKRRENGQ